MSLAHFLTCFRIFLIPFFPIFYYQYSWFGLSLMEMPYVLIGILGVCELTDLFDGIIARKRNEVTDLGKVLDPMADSIMRITVFFTFSQGVIALPLIIGFAFMYRDFFISTLRTLCALKGVALAARKTGKIKAIIQAVVSFAILVLLIPYTHGIITLEHLRLVSLFLGSIAAIYSVTTAIDYIYANRHYIKKAIQ